MEFKNKRFIDDGTGQFHEVILPELPSNKKEILFWNKEKQDQYWIPPSIPKEFDNWTTDKQIEYLKEDLQRRKNGVFFFNNGKVEYITGIHYFYLTHWKIDVGLPFFKDTDRDFFYLWDKAVISEWILGLFQITNRRDGKTHRGNCILYEYASINKESVCAIQSKTNSDAAAVFRKLIQSWQKIHWALRPCDSGETFPAKELKFQEPSKKSSKGEKKIYKDVLNSAIIFKPSNEESLDGFKIKRYFGDEVGKTVEANIVARHQIVKECLVVGKNKIGCGLYTTTVEELEVKGGMNAYIMWDEADMKKANEQGRNNTVNSLIRYFKSAEKGLEGFIDKYGYSVIEDPEKPIMGNDGRLIKQGSKSYIQERRKGLSGSALASEKRKYPITISEAFLQDGKLSPFDVIKLNDQHDYNQQLPASKIVTGNFKWSSESGKQVEFVHNPNGRWSVLWMPPEIDRNKTVFEKGIYRPSNYRTMTSGVDPYDHKTTSDNRKSNGASYVFRKLDVMSPYSSNMFVSEYSCRPVYPEAFYLDIAMQSIFYGTEILCENNKIGLIRWFENNGFHNYLMDRPDITHTEWSKARQKEKGVPMSGAEARQAVVNEMETFVYKNVGTNDETQEMGRMYFNKLVKCLINFDPNKWTDYDEFVGAGLALVATKKYSPAQIAPKGYQFYKTYKTR